MVKLLMLLSLEALAIFAFLYAKGKKLPETLAVKGWVRKYPLRISPRMQRHVALQEVGFLLLAPGASIPWHRHDDNNEIYVGVSLKGIELLNVCLKGGEHHLENNTGKFMLVLYVKYRSF